MATSCYLVLGVDHHATASQIRRAFRQFVHDHPPDDRVPGSAEQFDAAQEAFDTLSHTARRADHDRALLAEDAAAADDLPHDLTPPINLFSSFDTHRPSRQVLFDLLRRNFTGRGIPKSRPVHAVVVELVLSPQQAARGGRVPIDVPVAGVCTRCNGTGTTGYSPCDACDGHGLFWDAARVDVLLSPHVGDGTTIPVSLRHLGVENLYLNVNVRVTAG